MKKLLPILFLLLGLRAQAQVIILNENMFQDRMTEIRASVVDSLTNEPVAFASVYVIPAKDTTITNFTLTNDKGEAKLEEVPFGQYTLHIEMMGFKPFVKSRYFRERVTELGTVKLQQDEQYLQAAVINEVGNPIIVKKDTVEFNASSFRVGTNAMLKDLLKRMPGMEITDDGKVKFNGEVIDKITVGGRTFFFNDQNTALNNLPASVVDKVRVINRDSEQTRATGLQDGQKEKILDVGLKKEYEKGWFGNVGAKGGATVAAAKADEPLRDNRGFLFGANALVSAYNEKDQVTVIANGQNVDDSGMVFIVSDGDNNWISSAQGLSTSAQAAVNANTSRIKDVETTVGVNGKYTDTDSGTQASRTTFQADGNLLSKNENKGKQYGSSVTANAEMKKETGKIWFHVRPTFTHGRTEGFTNGNSQVTREGTWINSATSSTHLLNRTNEGELSGDVFFRELGGKKDRTLVLSAEGSLQADKGNSEESSRLETGSGTDLRNLRYDNRNKQYSVGGTVRYTEPFGEKWLLSAMASIRASRSERVRDASDAGGANDYYSSLSRNRNILQEYRLTAQYKWAQGRYVSVGARVSGLLDETFSRSFGVSETTGKNEWHWFVAPNVRFRYNKDSDQVDVSASGYARQPGAQLRLPVLNIADPSRLTLGNIYLKPYGNINLYANWYRNNRKRFSFVNLFWTASLGVSPVGYARWYDASGVLYSVPVNSRRPSFDTRLYANYTFPLDSKKLWSLSLGTSLSFNAQTSYQAAGTLPGLDKDQFDYTAFMADFWGDAAGSRFYGGQSGFKESLTTTFTPAGNLSLKFNPEHFSLGLRLSTSAMLARYSLAPSLNMNTTHNSVSLEGSYTTPHEFELSTDVGYHFYTGYKDGFNQPEWQWNAEVSKNIGAFTLSLKAHDILNQTRGRNHTVTANYEEDSYRLVLGRYILFGVKWNFGKMNAAHSQRAQQAAWNMAW